MEGIVLKSTPYQEEGKILKIFMKSLGVVHVIVKQVRKKQANWNTITSPLSMGEFHLSRKSSQLYGLTEASPIDLFLEIRESLEKLQASFAILNGIYLSQYPEKPSPRLFALTKSYLSKLKTSFPPDLLSSSFLLKIMNHEGLFPADRSDLPFPINDEEWMQLEILCHAKKFEDLMIVTLDEALKSHIQALHQSAFPKISTN